LFPIGSTPCDIETIGQNLLALGPLRGGESGNNDSQHALKTANSLRLDLPVVVNGRHPVRITSTDGVAKKGLTGASRDNREVYFFAVREDFSVPNLQLIGDTKVTNHGLH